MWMAIGVLLDAAVLTVAGLVTRGLEVRDFGAALLAALAIEILRRVIGFALGLTMFVPLPPPIEPSWHAYASLSALPFALSWLSALVGLLVAGIAVPGFTVRTLWSVLGVAVVIAIVHFAGLVAMVEMSRPF